MNRQNVILALGLLLVLANGIASGEIPQLWSTVKGINGNTTIAPSVNIPGVGPTTITPGGVIGGGGVTVGPNGPNLTLPVI